KSTWI
ncbi:phosphoglycerate transport system sensor PgtB domain protein, partial [Vibrio parahaemolyticus V-223/04]